MKHGCAHSGIAVEATGAQSCVPAVHVGSTEVPPGPEVSSDLVVEPEVSDAEPEVASELDLEVSDADPEDVSETDPEVSDVEPEVVSEVEPSEVSGVVVPAKVSVAVAEQGVVGLASTQAHKALTELRTWMPVSMPHPSMTQPWAAFWMIDVDEHWHSKSSVEQPASVTAAEKMQVSAQSGTASALA